MLREEIYMVGEGVGVEFQDMNDESDDDVDDVDMLECLFPALLPCELFSLSLT